MSDPNLLPPEVFPPTVSGLYYVLGNLNALWKKIGASLKIPPHVLEDIASKNNNDRCMIEVFCRWILSTPSSDCKWSTIVSALEDIGQEKLATTVRDFIHIHPSKDEFNWLLIRSWSKQGKKIECADVKEIVERLERIKNQWYKLGCLLHLEKQTLDEIEESNNNDFQQCLFKIFLKLSKSMKCTWAGLQFILNEMGLINQAKAIEQLANSKKIQHITFQQDLKRKDFIPRYYNERYFDKIRKVLKVPHSVSDDSMLENLYEHIRTKKKSSGLTLDDLEVITYSMKSIAVLNSDYITHIRATVKELEGELKQNKKIIKYLKKVKGEIEFKISRLNNEEKRITDLLKEPHDQSLKHELRTVKSKIEQATAELSKCNLQAKEAEVEYDVITEKLEECKKKLFMVQRSLTNVHKESIKWSNNKELTKAESVAPVQAPVQEQEAGKKEAASTRAATGAVAGAATGSATGAFVGAATGAIVGLGVFSVPAIAIGASLGATVVAATGAAIGYFYNPSNPIADSIKEVVEFCAYEIEQARKQIVEIQKLVFLAESEAKQLRFGVLT